MDLNESKDQVSIRQREEIRDFREDVLKPLRETQDESRAKFARAIIDILKILHEAERKAYGFADGEAVDTKMDVSFME